METIYRKPKPAFLFCLVAFLALSIAGCLGGRDGSSGRLPGSSGGPGSETLTTVKTKLALSYRMTEPPPRAAALLTPDIETLYSTAVVTLTLPDGTTFTMGYDGNGEYSCVVQNLADGTAGYIEAKINDNMVLKNFFDEIMVENDVLDTGSTGADSTFAADVLAAFASVVDLTDILADIESATLSIDVKSLTSEATSGTDADYELARRTYKSVLTWDNIDKDTGEIAGLLDSGAWQSLTEKISDELLNPPVTGTEADQVKAFTEGFLTAFFVTKTEAALAPYLSSTGFLMGGLTRAGFIASAASEWATSPVFIGATAGDFSGLALSVTAPSTFPVTGMSGYHVKINGTYTLSYGANPPITRAWDGPDRGIFIARSGSSWVILGDLKQMSHGYTIEYINGSTGEGRFTEVNLWAASGTLTPTSVQAEIKGTEWIEEVFATDGPRDFEFSLKGKAGGDWVYYNGETSLGTGIDYFAMDSRVLKVTTSFTGLPNEVFERVIELQSPVTELTSFAQNVDGSITFGWRPPTVDELLLRVDVKLVKSGVTYSFPPTTRSLTISRATLNAAGFTFGTDDFLDIVYHTATARYAYRYFFVDGYNPG